MNRPGYCIFVNTLFQGAVPSVHESAPDTHPDAPNRICVFETEREAQLEIVDLMMTRMQEFIDGHRDFEDAISTEEYVVAVEVLPDGSVIDEHGNHFGGTGRSYQ